jgi:hypothetical protein
MWPRTAPEWEGVGVSQEALEELKKYGALQEFKADMTSAVLFWQETARVMGLPSSWRHRGLVMRIDDDHTEHWHVYVEKVNGIFMGFDESPDGCSLRLLLLMPAKLMTLRAALDETRRRV